MDFSNSSLAKLEKMRDTLTEKVQREQERAKNTPIGGGPAADANRKSMEQRYTEQLDVIEQAIFKAEMADMEQQPTTSTAAAAVDALADTTAQEAGGSVGDNAKVRAATETTSSSGTAPAAAASSLSCARPSTTVPLTASTLAAVQQQNTGERVKVGEAALFPSVPRPLLPSQAGQSQLPPPGFKSAQGGKKGGTHVELQKQIIRPCDNFFKGGRCRYGAECRFSHKEGVHSQQRPPCDNFFKGGSCKYGAECRFSHTPGATIQAHNNGIRSLLPAPVTPQQQPLGFNQPVPARNRGTPSLLPAPANLQQQPLGFNQPHPATNPRLGTPSDNGNHSLLPPPTTPQQQPLGFNQPHPGLGTASDLLLMAAVAPAAPVRDADGWTPAPTGMRPQVDAPVVVPAAPVPPGASSVLPLGSSDLLKNAAAPDARSSTIEELLPQPRIAAPFQRAPISAPEAVSEWRIVPSGPPPLVATAAVGQPYFREHRDRRSRSRHHQHKRSASSRDDERRAHERRKRSRSRGESRKHRSSHRRRD